MQQEHISFRIHSKPITSLTTRIWGMCYGLARNTMPPLANLSSVLIHSSFDCFCYCLQHVSIGRNTYTTHPVKSDPMTLEECLAIYPCGDDISTSGFPSAYMHPLNFIKEKKSTVNLFTVTCLPPFVVLYTSMWQGHSLHPTTPVLVWSTLWLMGSGCKVLMPTIWHTFWDSVLTISTILQHTQCTTVDHPSHSTH